MRRRPSQLAPYFVTPQFSLLSNERLTSRPVESRCAGIGRGGSRRRVIPQTQPFRYSRRVFRYGLGRVRNERSDGAKAWSTVLSELAQVTVAVGRGGCPGGRPDAGGAGGGQGGPRRADTRVGAPLPIEDLHFARSSLAVAIALAWLARGSPVSPGRGTPQDFPVGNSSQGHDAGSPRTGIATRWPDVRGGPNSESRELRGSRRPHWWSSR